jgi:hypothetical protein
MVGHGGSLQYLSPWIPLNYAIGQVEHTKGQVDDLFSRGESWKVGSGPYGKGYPRTP